jgi:ribosomal protein uL22
MYMYSTKFKDESKVAKARVEDVDASFKDLIAVCDNIRLRRTDIAVDMLEKASKGLIPLRYWKHNTHMGHRHELMGQKGRYPKKAAGIVLKALKSVIANARIKGLGEDRLIVIHAAANKQNIYRRLQPKGLRKRHDYETARVELAVAEIVRKAKPAAKTKAKPTTAEKPKSSEAKQ